MAIEGTDAHNAWIKDGSASAAPVTESTPSLTPSDGGSDPSSSGEKGSPPTGGSEHTPSTATATGSTDAPAAATPSLAQQEYIEALLDGKPYQLPKGIQLPWKRGTEKGFDPVDKVLAERMMERDYRIKTAEIARAKHDMQQYLARFEAERAKVEMEKQWVKEETDRLRKALTDPKELASLDDHYERYEKDPRYKKWVDDAQTKRQLEAEVGAYRQQEQAQVEQQAAVEIHTAINRIVAEQYPGVDPNVVAARYAQALTAGQAQISEQEIHRFAAQEAAVAQRYRAPLQTELETLKTQAAEAAELRKRLEKLEAREAKNGTTAHALNRAKAPSTAPAGGAPTGVPTPKAREPYTSEKMGDVIRDWTKKGTTR